MKTILQQVRQTVAGMHPFPQWVLVGFVYAAVITYTLCAAAGFGLWGDPCEATARAQALFETGTGFLAAGGLGVPLMDLMWRRGG